MEIKIFVNYQLKGGLPVGFSFESGSTLRFLRKRYSVANTTLKSGETELGSFAIATLLRYMPPEGVSAETRYFMALVSNWDIEGEGDLPSINHVLKIGDGEWSVSGAVDAYTIETKNKILDVPGKVWTLSK